VGYKEWPDINCGWTLHSTVTWIQVNMTDWLHTGLEAHLEVGIYEELTLRSTKKEVICGKNREHSTWMSLSYVSAQQWRLSWNLAHTYQTMIVVFLTLVLVKMICQLITLGGIRSTKYEILKYVYATKYRQLAIISHLNESLTMNIR